MEINCFGKLLDISNPVVMGILNITPDSFFDGGKYLDKNQILNRAQQIINEGAKIIDIGAYSSRPGADDVSEDEEINRLDNALSIIREHMPEVCISIDTFRANVARFAVENHNANIINDISAGFADDNMLQTVRDLNVPYIMMHMKGTPQNMQLNPQYDNVFKEVTKYFSERIKTATLLGIKDIIIDSGFGFGKTIEHNYELLKRLEDFKIIGYPILVGVSRKSMIYKHLNITPNESLPGTIVLNTIAILKGANIIRVHDVLEAVQAVELIKKMNS